MVSSLFCIVFDLKVGCQLTVFLENDLFAVESFMKCPCSFDENACVSLSVLLQCSRCERPGPVNPAQAL